MFNEAELVMIRKAFNSEFKAKQLPTTLGFDEAPAAMNRLDLILDMLDLDERTCDRATLIKQLDLYNRSTALFDVVQMHTYVLAKMSDLISDVTRGQSATPSQGEAQ